MFWSSREALTAFFGGPVVGWEVEQFEGPATLLSPGEHELALYTVGGGGTAPTLRLLDRVPSPR